MGGSKATILVNVASAWGGTARNYRKYKSMYDAYHSRGLQIIAVPCNQFGKQEPKSNEEIKALVLRRYDAEFPIIEKTQVKGDGAHPIYQNLKQQLPESEVKWNFAKYLINEEGRAIKFYDHKFNPDDIVPDFEPMLNAQWKDTL